MDTFGLTREQLGQMAVVARATPRSTPGRCTAARWTLEDYLAARMIDTPLCLFDCDVPCDGSTAWSSRTETAPDCPHPIQVNALGTACGDVPPGTSGRTSPPWRRDPAPMWQRTDWRGRRG